MGRHMDCNTEREIYKLLLDEMPVKRICARLNVTDNQVKRVAHVYGVKVKKEKWGLTLTYEKLQGDARNVPKPDYAIKRRKV